MEYLVALLILIRKLIDLALFLPVQLTKHLVHLLFYIQDF